ncbi:MAG TPA: septal ring lytic transglycosylase RlpA family protein [Solirubrobacteraceae bacterium]
MRTTNMRSRTVRITAGALAIAAPASAVALAAGQADALSALQITPAADHLGFGHPLTVTGLAPRTDGGYRLALEFSAAGAPWRTLSHTKVHSDGAFRLRAPLTRSGAVRVVPVTPPAPAPATVTDDASSLSAPPSPAAISASEPAPVTVAAKLTTAAGAMVAGTSHPLKVRGTLLPRHAGAVVRLQRRARRRWRTIATTRTRGGGRFLLRDRVRAAGKQTVRVSFAGDAGNASVSTPGRSLISLHPALASWYDDAGNTACGFHAGDGVASKSLPCGTKVTFAYHGRTVTAVVDDRGPFVPGRQFDLDQATAAALGFDGVDTVWSSV